MEIRQLRHFVALAETLNFRRASERLHISQPPLTASIKKLEAEIGTALFERSTHKVTLTSAGLAALESAQRAIQHAENVRRAALAGAGGEVGEVDLGFVGSAAYQVVPQLLAAFRERFPAVTLQLHESSASQLIEKVRQGTLDAALVRSLPQSRFGPGLKSILLEADHLMLALPQGHPIAGRDSLRLDDLRGEPFIAYTELVGLALRSLWNALFLEAGFEPRVEQRATQVQTMIFLVRSGIGVALVPSSASAHLPDGVVLREIEGLGQRARMAIAMVYSTADEMPQVTALVRIAQSVARF